MDRYKRTVVLIPVKRTDVKYSKFYELFLPAATRALTRDGMGTNIRSYVPHEQNNGTGGCESRKGYGFKWLNREIRCRRCYPE